MSTQKPASRSVRNLLDTEVAQSADKETDLTAEEVAEVLRDRADDLDAEGFEVIY